MTHFGGGGEAVGGMLGEGAVNDGDQRIGDLRKALLNRDRFVFEDRSELAGSFGEDERIVTGQQPIERRTG